MSKTMNEAIEHISASGGVEIHVGLDNRKAIYCEDREHAHRLAEALARYCPLNPSVENGTEIETCHNGTISVFPICFGNPQGNCVIITSHDLLIGPGIVAAFNDPRVHVTSLKVFPLPNNSDKKSERRSRGATR